MRLHSHLRHAACLLLSATAIASAQRGTAVPATTYLMKVNGQAVGPVRQVTRGATHEKVEIKQNGSTNADLAEKWKGPTNGQNGPFSVAVGLPAGKAVADWLDASLRDASAHAAGTIAFVGASKVAAEWSWENGRIVAAQLSDLSGDGKDVPTLTLDIAVPEQVKLIPGNGSAAPSQDGSFTRMLPTRFVLQIGGLQTMHAVRVESYTLQPGRACEPLTVMLNATDLKTLEAADAHVRRSGELKLMTAAMGHEVFGLQWTGMQITHLDGPPLNATSNPAWTGKATFSCDHVQLGAGHAGW